MARGLGDSVLGTSLDLLGVRSPKKAEGITVGGEMGLEVSPH